MVTLSSPWNEICDKRSRASAGFAAKEGSYGRSRESRQAQMLMLEGKDDARASREVTRVRQVKSDGMLSNGLSSSSRMISDLGPFDGWGFVVFFSNGVRTAPTILKFSCSFHPAVAVAICFVSRMRMRTNIQELRETKRFVFHGSNA
jgi:hypothetical protein